MLELVLGGQKVSGVLTRGCRLQRHFNSFRRVDGRSMLIRYGDLRVGESRKVLTVLVLFGVQA